MYFFRLRRTTDEDYVESEAFRQVMQVLHISTLAISAEKQVTAQGNSLIIHVPADNQMDIHVLYFAVNISVKICKHLQEVILFLCNYLQEIQQKIRHHRDPLSLLHTIFQHSNIL